MIEKRNIVESGRTPHGTEKTAEVVDEGVALFGTVPKKPDQAVKNAIQPKKEPGNAGKTVDR